MEFSQPLFVYIALVLIPIVAGFSFYVIWQRRQDLKTLGQMGMIEKMLQPFSNNRRILQGILFSLAALLLAFTLAGPRYGVKMVEVNRQGVDVMIALDVSKSMLAEDIKPNRLERAKQELTALIDRLKGDRVGVIAFAGKAQTACPLTTDYSAAKMFLSYLSPDTVMVPGTALSEAIQLSIKSYPKGGEGYRVLVLLTDGEDHEAKVLEAAQEAKAAGVKILSIGFGSPDGEPIPLRNAQGAIVGYVKDQKGKTVVTKLDEGTLKKITALTGGAYVPAHQGLLEAETVADIIKGMQKKDISSGQYGAAEDRYQYLLFPALLLLLLAFWLPLRKGAWLVMVLLLVGFQAPAVAGPAEAVNKGNDKYKTEKYDEAMDHYRDAQIKKPDEAIVNYNLGNTYHQKQNYDEAEKAYKRALKTKNKALKSKIQYNLGNNYFKQQNYKEAEKAYRKTLKLKPKDEDALYNLAQTILVQKNPEMQQKQKEKRDQEKKDKEKKEQKQQQAQKGKQDKKNQKEDQQKQASKQDQKQDGAKPGDKQGGPDDKGEEKADPDESTFDENQQTPEEQPAPKPGEMRKEDAENILDAVREAEQQAQKERMKKKGQKVRGRGKADW